MKASKMKIINSIFKTFVLSVLMVAQVHFAYAQNAAILPPAKTTFVDQNGKPLTSGTVDFYVPGTTTRKTTWQDSAGTIPNTNPVVLDGAGRAVVLGNGAYRQVVKDRLGNQQWDQVTSSTGAGGSGSITVGDGNAVGTVLPYSGLVAPSNYAFPYGQELSRTTYSQLLTAITLTQNVTCVSGNPTLTVVADTSQLNIGAAVEAACVPAGATIISKTVSTVTLTANATVGATTTATFYPWGNGNGLTTFNAPDFRGVVLPGRNNMGGSNSVNLSTPYYTDPNAIAGAGGSQSKTMLASNNPSYTPTGTIAFGASNTAIQSAATGGTAAFATANTIGTTGNMQTALAQTATFTGASANGGIAASATVAAGGSGYTPGTQLLTVSGGTCTTQPQFNVTIAAGAITAPVLVTAGLCSVAPSNPASTTGGGGTAGTLNIVYSAVPFSLIQPSKTINYIIKTLPDVNLSIARCANLIDAGTACTYNIGTSGNTIPLNNTANSFSALQTFSAGVAVSGGTTSITGLTTPTTPSDAATKAYVDSVATGLNILSQSRLATAAVLPNTPTYGNGALGVGATLTAGSNTTLTVDGTLAALNDIILVKNQASAFQNGVYTLTQVGSGAQPWILTRATYFDQAAEMKAGSYTLITTGSTNAGTSWALQAAVTTVGTDPLNWLQFSATAGVTSVGGFNGIVTNAQVTSSCNIFSPTLSGCVPSGAGTTTISQLNPSTQTWATPTALVVQSRATAAALNLTGVNSVQTLGYATAGDGGQAVFKNVGSAAFIDSFVNTFSIQGGSGCTNGSFVGLYQKSGNPAYVVGPITVAGGAVTAVDVSHSPGNAYTVGDVLTLFGLVQGGVFQSITCGVTPTITITAVTAPLGSFTDTAGNHFQIVSDPFPNVLQFGCKGDWDGVDGTSTNNWTCMQSAAWFAGYRRTNTSFDAGGSWGGYLYVPPGAYNMCGSTNFVLPAQTVMDGGQASGQATLHLCDAYNASIHAFTICDALWQFACLGTQYRNLSFHASRNVAVSGGASMLYSNNLQDFGGLYNVYVYCGQRLCIHIEKGYGGSSWMGIERISVNSSSPNNPMIKIGNTAASGMNLGSTIVSIRDIVIGGPSSAPYHMQSGMYVYGGFTNIENVHCENINGECIYVESPASGNPIQMRFTNINSQGCASGGTCNGIVTLAGTNDPGNVIFSMIPAGGGYAHVINNGQPGGTSYNANIKGPLICVLTCKTEVIP